MRDVSFWFLMLSGLTQLSADTVYLRSGQVIEGSITAFNASGVTIRTESGVQTVPRSQIQRMAYGPSKKEAAPEKKEIQPDPRLEAARKQAAAQREAQQKAAQDQAALMELARADQALEESISFLRSIRESDVRFERNQALWRSAILPGWGQLHLDHYGRGMFFVGAAGATYSFWSANMIEIRRWENIYNSASTPMLLRFYFGTDSIPATYLFFQGIKQKVRSHEANLEIATLMASITWALSMADIWYNHTEKFNLSLLIRPEIQAFLDRSFEPGRSAAQIQLTFTFNH